MYLPSPLYACRMFFPRVRQYWMLESFKVNNQIKGELHYAGREAFN